MLFDAEQQQNLWPQYNTHLIYHISINMLLYLRSNRINFKFLDVSGCERSSKYNPDAFVLGGNSKSAPGGALCLYAPSELGAHEAKVPPKI